MATSKGGMLLLLLALLLSVATGQEYMANVIVGSVPSTSTKVTVVVDAPGIIACDVYAANLPFRLNSDNLDDEFNVWVPQPGQVHVNRTDHPGIYWWGGELVMPCYTQCPPEKVHIFSQKLQGWLCADRPIGYTDLTCPVLGQQPEFQGWDGQKSIWNCDVPRPDSLPKWPDCPSGWVRMFDRVVISCVNLYGNNPTLDSDNKRIRRTTQDTGRGMQFISTYTIDAPGMVEYWKVDCWVASELTLQVWRSIGGTDELQYRQIGSHTQWVAQGVHSIKQSTPFQVQAGDVLGWYSPTVQPIPYSTGGRTVRRIYQTPGPGDVDVSSHNNGWRREYSVGVVLSSIPEPLKGPYTGKLGAAGCQNDGEFVAIQDLDACARAVEAQGIFGTVQVHDSTTPPGCSFNPAELNGFFNSDFTSTVGRANYHTVCAQRPQSERGPPPGTYIYTDPRKDFKAEALQCERPTDTTAVCRSDTLFPTLGGVARADIIGDNVYFPHPVDLKGEWKEDIQAVHFYNGDGFLAHLHTCDLQKPGELALFEKCSTKQLVEELGCTVADCDGTVTCPKSVQTLVAAMCPSFGAMPNAN